MGRCRLDILLEEDVFACRSCRTHLTRLCHLVSKDFTGKTGQAAYLFANVVNVRLGDPEDQLLQTGLHTIKKVFCKEDSCDAQIGWMYTDAHDSVNKYKVGKVCLERCLISPAF